MSGISLDVDLITLRNITACNPDNSLVSTGYVLVTSTNGEAYWQGSLSSFNISTLNTNNIDMNNGTINGVALISSPHITINTSTGIDVIGGPLNIDNTNLNVNNGDINVNDGNIYISSGGFLSTNLINMTNGVINGLSTINSSTLNINTNVFTISSSSTFINSGTLVLQSSIIIDITSSNVIVNNGNIEVNNGNIYISSGFLSTNNINVDCGIINNISTATFCSLYPDNALVSNNAINSYSAYQLEFVSSVANNNQQAGGDSFASPFSPLTYTVPAGVDFMLFEMVGSGSYGNQSENQAGPGGYMKGIINLKPFVGSTLNIYPGYCWNTRASYINISSGPLLAVAGAGGCGGYFSTNAFTISTGFNGGEGGGGTFNANGVAPGGNGFSPYSTLVGAGGGGSIMGNTFGGNAGILSTQYLVNGWGLNGGPGSNATGNIDVNGGTSFSYQDDFYGQGGDGYAGGGGGAFYMISTSGSFSNGNLSTCAGGGGGSSYYNKSYVTLISSYSGFNFSTNKVLTTIPSNYGLSTNSGYINLSTFTGFIGLEVTQDLLVDGCISTNCILMNNGLVIGLNTVANGFSTLGSLSVTSTLNASSINTNNVNTSSLNTSSIFAGILSTNNVNTSSIYTNILNTSSINASSISTNYITMNNGQISGLSTIKNDFTILGSLYISTPSLTQTVIYSTIGGTNINIPPWANTMIFEVFGAGGGTGSSIVSSSVTISTGGAGGAGGYIKGIASLAGINSLGINVGQTSVSSSYSFISTSSGNFITIAGSGGGGGSAGNTKITNGGSNGFGGGGGGGNIFYDISGIGKFSPGINGANSISPITGGIGGLSTNVAGGIPGLGNPTPQYDGGQGFSSNGFFGGLGGYSGTSTLGGSVGGGGSILYSSINGIYAGAGGGGGSGYFGGGGGGGSGYINVLFPGYDSVGGAGGGGGSSYITSGITLISSFDGSTIVGNSYISTLVPTGFGRANQNGYVSITFLNNYSLVTTNGINVPFINTSSISTNYIQMTNGVINGVSSIVMSGSNIQGVKNINMSTGQITGLSTISSGFTTLGSVTVTSTLYASSISSPQVTTSSITLNGKDLNTVGTTLYFNGAEIVTGSNISSISSLYWRETGNGALYNTNIGVGPNYYLVGVGTSTLNATLDVSGSIRAGSYLSTNQIQMNYGQINGLSSITGLSSINGQPFNTGNDVYWTSTINGLISSNTNLPIVVGTSFSASTISTNSINFISSQIQENSNLTLNINTNTNAIQFTSKDGVFEFTNPFTVITNNYGSLFVDNSGSLVFTAAFSTNKGVVIESYGSSGPKFKFDNSGNFLMPSNYNSYISSNYINMIYGQINGLSSITGLSSINGQPFNPGNDVYWNSINGSTISSNTGLPVVVGTSFSASTISSNYMNMTNGQIIGLSTINSLGSNTTVGNPNFSSISTTIYGGTINIGGNNNFSMILGNNQSLTSTTIYGDSLQIGPGNTTNISLGSAIEATKFISLNASTISMNGNVNFCLDNSIIPRCGNVAFVSSYPGLNTQIAPPFPSPLTYTVPSGVDFMLFEMVGSGSFANQLPQNPAGPGGYMKGIINLKPFVGSTLNIYPGYCWSNRGSYINISSGPLLAVAGAGGAGGYSINLSSGFNGGEGGGGYFDANGVAPGGNGFSLYSTLASGGLGGSNVTDLSGGFGGVLSSGFLSQGWGLSGGPGSNATGNTDVGGGTSYGDGSQYYGQGGNGYAGGGGGAFYEQSTGISFNNTNLSTCAGGGGGSSYYNKNYVTLLASYSGFNFSTNISLTTIPSTAGLPQTSGYINVSTFTGFYGLEVTKNLLVDGYVSTNYIQMTNGVINGVSSINMSGSNIQAVKTISMVSGEILNVSSINGVPFNANNDVYWTSTSNGLISSNTSLPIVIGTSLSASTISSNYITMTSGQINGLSSIAGLSTVTNGFSTLGSISITSTLYASSISSPQVNTSLINISNYPLSTIGNTLYFNGAEIVTGSNISSISSLYWREAGNGAIYNTNIGVSPNYYLVGVGTSTLNATLDVSGSIRAGSYLSTNQIQMINGVINGVNSIAIGSNSNILNDNNNNSLDISTSNDSIQFTSKTGLFEFTNGYTYNINQSGDLYASLFTDNSGSLTITAAGNPDVSNNIGINIQSFGSNGPTFQFDNSGNFLMPSNVNSYISSNLIQMNSGSIYSNNIMTIDTTTNQGNIYIGTSNNGIINIGSNNSSNNHYINGYVINNLNTNLYTSGVITNGFTLSSNTNNLKLTSGFYQNASGTIAPAIQAYQASNPSSFSSLYINPLGGNITVSNANFSSISTTIYGGTINIGGDNCFNLNLGNDESLTSTNIYGDSLQIGPGNTSTISIGSKIGATQLITLNSNKTIQYVNQADTRKGIVISSTQTDMSLSMGFYDISGFGIYPSLQSYNSTTITPPLPQALYINPDGGNTTIGQAAPPVITYMQGGTVQLQNSNGGTINVGNPSVNTSTISLNAFSISMNASTFTKNGGTNAGQVYDTINNQPSGLVSTLNFVNSTFGGEIIPFTVPNSGMYILDLHLYFSSTGASLGNNPNQFIAWGLTNSAGSVTTNIGGNYYFDMLLNNSFSWGSGGQVAPDPTIINKSLFCKLQNNFTYYANVNNFTSINYVGQAASNWNIGSGGYIKLDIIRLC